MKRVGAFLFAVALSCALVAPVVAHEELSIEALAVLNSVSPDIEGVQVRVLLLTAPVMVVTNTNEKPFVVIGVDGEPAFRISKDRVEANLNSPTAYRASDPTGQRPLPQNIDPQRLPRWSIQDRSDTWTWFDPRIVFVRGGPTEWSVPAQIDGTSVSIDGGFELIDGHGHFISSLVSAPSVKGLELRFMDASVPVLYARNTSDRLLTVPGLAGEPFLRIGPRGVFANVRSPSLYLAGETTIRAVPAIADPAAPPRWKRLSKEPLWGWLEYRARLPEGSEQRSSLGPERKTVHEWVTPMQLGGRPLELAGQVEWVPGAGHIHPAQAATPKTNDDDPTSMVVAALASIGIVVGGLVYARRAGRRRQPAADA